MACAVPQCLPGVGGQGNPSRLNDLVGIHRTYLSPYHLPEKASLGDKTKMALGAIKGSCRAARMPQDKLLLGEGIETLLCASLLSGVLGGPSSVRNSRKSRFPPNVRHVIIAADNDDDKNQQSIL